ncbi:YggS family pyridoxal phosphate-dependent enzyme [Roseomonas sp. 18066]|uniref:YggS family pyridoxal phosphate-dependent enzyme n=1 Tax=Roseomonas sp. 18066 TaxID=2681412 RepID=UPI00135765C0|nr:YggS family pyridoxal phosphate-dependent enzyme [Roseomonas sp. 18066]
MSSTIAPAPLTAEEIERFGPDPEARFRDNLAALEARIAAACQRAGRDRSEVRLLPVTKTVPASVLRLAHAAGVTTFGENKIQEATGKREALADLPIAWSIIGHLQTNKVKHLARLAQEFHALDSLRLAGLLEARLAQEGQTMDVFVQVNTSGEASKYGLPPAEVPAFLDALPRFPHLRPRGFMTLALFSSDMAQVRPCFARLRDIRDAALRDHPGLAALSMGMTGDFEAAIAEGASIIRVGQAIFGRRPTPDGHYWPGLLPTPG